jgi:hypothetical protein
VQFISDHVNFLNLRKQFKAAGPFNHVVIDNFFEEDTAERLVEEFPEFDSDSWHEYLNPIEIKRTCNNWNVFPERTYQVFNYLCSREFTDEISKLTGGKLHPDPGLNGGGWHTHRESGKLNTHLDYSIHPKLKLERKLNIIIYISKGWRPEWGGNLGLWEHNEPDNSCGELIKTVDCIFNRAVIFDTTQNSWHGLPDPIVCPKSKTRNSLAAYYTCEPSDAAPKRDKALYTPCRGQEEDDNILNLIKLRSDSSTSASVYRSLKE